MNMQAELWGGPRDGDVLGIPDGAPETILMPQCPASFTGQEGWQNVYRRGAPTPEGWRYAFEGTRPL